MFPTFVPVQQIAHNTISFRWDDWDPYAAVGDPPPERVELLGYCSDRALVGYSTACAEWVVYRFSKLSDDPTSYRYLEALWTYCVDPRYRPPLESNEDDWKGPIRGPMDLALMTVLNTIGSTDGGKAEVDAALAEQIAWHVLEDKTHFSSWRDRCLDRLLLNFSRRSDHEHTGGIAPQWFDLNVPTEMRSSFAQQFLETVDFDANEFLRDQEPTH